MSYCRRGDDSDVYVYRDNDGRLRCAACSLSAETVAVATPDEMLQHLQRHQAQGHRVPPRAITRLQQEKDGQSS